MMKTNHALLLICALTALVHMPINTANATTTKPEPTTHKSYRASKKVPAMRNRVYTQLARAQQLADEGDKIEGFAVLDEVKDKLNSLNAYEQAMLFNFYGFMYYGNEDIDMALDSFKRVVADKVSIPDSLVISTLYSLAQLSMQQQNYSQALIYLQQWQAVNAKPLTANQQILFAQVHYQDKAYEKSLTYINQAIALVEKEQKLPKENWLILQRAAYYELKQPEQVTKVMEQLVRLFDKAEYWLQLAGMYGEIGQENKQMAVMEAAFQAGYIKKPADMLTLAQLYLFHGAPFKSANLLENAIANGTVVAEEKNLAVLARAYLAAKEDRLAIKVLSQLTDIASSGEYDALLAQTYLNNEQWQLAISSATKAISRFESSDEKDDEKSSKANSNYLGNMYLAQGMANFNLKRFEQSITAFNKAQGQAKVKKTAQQWAKYVEREQQNYQVQLAMLTSSPKIN